MTTPFKTATSERAMKPTPAVIESGIPGSASVATPNERERIPREHDQGVAHRAERSIEQHQDQEQRYRSHDRKPLARRHQLFERPGIVEPITARQANPTVNARAQLLNEAAQVTPPDISGDRDPPLAVFAADLVGPSMSCRLATSPSGTNSCLVCASGTGIGIVASASESVRSRSVSRTRRRTRGGCR